MRIAFIVLAGLFLFISSGVSGMLAARNMSDASKLDEMQTKNSAAMALVKRLGAVSKEAREANELIERTGQMKTGGIVSGLVGLLAVVLFVMIFLKKGVMYGAGGLVLLSILAIALNPTWEKSIFGPAPSRPIAIVAGVIAIIGAGFAFSADLAYRAKRAKRLAA